MMYVVSYMIKLRVSKRPEFPSWIHFLRCFCRTEFQVGQCRDILQAIIDADNCFSSKDWIKVPKSSVGMYTKCLKILRENGLVEKRDGYYQLSRDLLIALEKTSDRWKDLVNSVNRGEKIELR